MSQLEAPADHSSDGLGGGAAQQLMEITMGITDNGQPQSGDRSAYNTATTGDLESWHTGNPSGWHNVPAPDPSVQSRMTLLNGMSGVVVHCTAGLVRGIRCVGRCGLNMGDQYETNRAIVQNIFGCERSLPMQIKADIYEADFLCRRRLLSGV